MDKEKKISIILISLAIVFTIIGSTFAYWSWTTNSAQQTAVNFTVTSGFSCSADGGGNITSNDKMLAPAACTNTTYAIQRTVTVSPTITQNGLDIYLDLWLKVNSIGEGLAASDNFKYALTTSSSSCTTGVVATGNFNGATTNTQKTLLHEKKYSTTTTDPYYLWIWLDAAETDSATQNQTFDIELGGSCTDEGPNYVYTVNLYDANVTNNNSVIIGSAIPNTITQYTTPEAAMAAFSNRPFYLKHRIQNNVVTESYVEFVVTSTMATNNPGMTAGTYYLKGGDSGAAFLDNAKTIYDAFGGVGCYLDGNSGGNPYTTTPSSNFYCYVSGLSAYANSNGYVNAYVGEEAYCDVDYGGASRCGAG